MNNNNSPKKIKITTRQVILILVVTVTAIISVIALEVSKKQPKAPAVITKTLDPQLTQSMDIDYSPKEISIVLVYKLNCDHCENARKVIENQLSKNSKHPIQLTQYSVESEQGQKYQELYHIHSTPLIVINNNTQNKSYALNDGSTDAVQKFLNKYLIQPTKQQKVN